MPKRLIEDEEEFRTKVTSGVRLEELQREYGFKHIDNVYYWCYRWNIPIPNRTRKHTMSDWKLTEKQTQLVIGTTLGDGYLQKQERTKNSCLVMTHGIHQKDYLEWKLEILGKFHTGTLYEYIQKTPSFSTLPRYTGRTVRHPLFSDYRNLFYPDGIKRITKELLSLLSPEGLAVWIMDDGWYRREGMVGLSTQSFTLEEHNLIREHFNDWLGLDARIQKCSGRQTGQHYFTFTVASSRILSKLLKPFFFTPMLYKLGF